MTVEKVVIETAVSRNEPAVAAEVLRRAMLADGLPEAEVERRLVARGLVENRAG